MAEIFLSYAREDRGRAEQVAQGLQAAGLDVFWDNEIPPGQTWADYIESKLAQCKALIVLWSEHSTKSQWVREEARLGRDKGVLIPVMMDASTPPFGFGEVQAANLVDWSGDTSDARWQRLVGAVKALDSAERPQPRPMTPPRASTAQQAAGWVTPAPEKKKGVPAWAWVVGVIVVLVIALGVIGNMNTSSPTATPQVASTVAQAPEQPAQQPQAPSAADASQYTQQVLARLNAAQQSFTQQGFQQITAPATGQLAQGQAWNVPVTLNAGGEYRIVGVCDNDCGDLDLVLYDAGNNVISRDEMTDAIPVVSVRPQVNGPYTVQAIMHTCANAPCYYALALYGRAIPQ